MRQSINLTSVENARELGGYETGCGIIRKGVLLRTGSPEKISGEDKKKLIEQYKLGMLVDFRMNSEKEQRPDPVIEGVENLHFPVMEMSDYEGYSDELAVELLSDDRMKMLMKAIEMGMLDDRLYITFVLKKRGMKAYKNFFKALLELPENRAVLWHCTDGKDRAGVAAMLLLTALGADERLIFEDYLLTNEFNAGKIEKVKAMLAGSSIPEEMRDTLLFGMGAVYERYMANAVRALKENYGSVMGYIEQELGIHEAELKELRHKFLV